MDDITSTAARYATFGTANAIDTAADAATSVSKADNTDIADAAATNIQDLLAYVAPPTADVAPPTADIAPPTANIAPPTADIVPPTANIAPPTTST
eukprot:g11886.t1